MSGGSPGCRETYAGAASGAGSIKMIGVLVGGYHFDLIFISATDSHGLTQTSLKKFATDPHRLTQTGLKIISQ